MAYPGIKESRAAELKEAIGQKDWGTIVDPFYGAGGLSKAFFAGHTADRHIAGESFEPLRSLYQNVPNLTQLADRFLGDMHEIGESALWAHLKQALRSESPRYGTSEAFVILNNLSHGNGMRHNKKGQQNLPIGPSKLKALIKRRSFIDPIVFRPNGCAITWQKTIGQAGGQDAIALLDPPYLLADSVYPNEDPLACGVPPVTKAMCLGYGAIVAYNSNSLELDFWFAKTAADHGYSVTMNVTEWATKYSAKSSKKASTEAMWIFKKEVEL